MSTLNNTLFTSLEENSFEQFNKTNTLVTDLVTELVTYPFPEDFNNFMDRIDTNQINIDNENNKLVCKPMQRSCRYIFITPLVYEYLITNGNEGYAEILAEGAGYVNWYLCHRNENYYFLYRSFNNSCLNGHLTSVDDINSLRCHKL